MWSEKNGEIREVQIVYRFVSSELLPTAWKHIEIDYVLFEFPYPDPGWKIQWKKVRTLKCLIKEEGQISGQGGMFSKNNRTGP